MDRLEQCVAESDRMADHSPHRVSQLLPFQHPTGASHVGAEQAHVDTRRSCAPGIVYRSSEIAVRPGMYLRSAPASFATRCSMPENAPAPFRLAYVAMPSSCQTPGWPPGEMPRFAIANLNAQYSSAPASGGTCVVVRETLATFSNFQLRDSAGPKDLQQSRHTASNSEQEKHANNFMGNDDETLCRRDLLDNTIGSCMTKCQVNFHNDLRPSRSFTKEFACELSQSQATRTSTLIDCMCIAIHSRATATT